MTFLWLIVWLINSTPNVNFSGHWNNWAIALVICAAMDILGGKTCLD